MLNAPPCSRPPSQLRTREHASCGGAPLYAIQTKSNEGHAPCLSCCLSLEILRDGRVRSQPRPTPHVPLCCARARKGRESPPKECTSANAVVLNRRRSEQALDLAGRDINIDVVQAGAGRQSRHRLDRADSRIDEASAD